MARPLRLDYCGAVWHLTSRGNDRQNIVRDDDDRQAFVDLLGRKLGPIQIAVRRQGWQSRPARSGGVREGESDRRRK